MRQLVGNWTLLSYVTENPDGSRGKPYGDAVGRLSYDEHGHMAGQVMRPGRMEVAPGEWGAQQVRSAYAEAGLFPRQVYRQGQKYERGENGARYDDGQGNAREDRNFDGLRELAHQRSASQMPTGIKRRRRPCARSWM